MFAKYTKAIQLLLLAIIFESSLSWPLKPKVTAGTSSKDSSEEDFASPSHHFPTLSSPFSCEDDEIKPIYSPITSESVYELRPPLGFKRNEQFGDHQDIFSIWRKKESTAQKLYGRESEHKPLEQNTSPTNIEQTTQAIQTTQAAQNTLNSVRDKTKHFLLVNPNELREISNYDDVQEFIKSMYDRHVIFSAKNISPYLAVKQPGIDKLHIHASGDSLMKTRKPLFEMLREKFDLTPVPEK
ncbi:uncharacterized protein LOC105187442 [Harpegnathos saltator]|uniref:uncharacterized protein LOC105187442 n=1 Tax=Harpegnathos saltator TaxID=610380 RepID=UPI00058AC706|nr:uncharacterized protein LOC105187442 [Harpegnathos saltator]